jgi:hypothetical protein
MKFEYNGKEDGRVCVAYIDMDGDLRIRTQDDDAVIFYANTKDLPSPDCVFTPSVSQARFYPGDKITITF